MQRKDFCLSLQNIARSNRHRYGIVVSGLRDWVEQETCEWIAEFQGKSRLIISAGEWTAPLQCSQDNDSGIVVSTAKTEKFLGGEYDLVVYDSFSGLDPDALGIVGGTIRAGGLLIIMTPELEDWPRFADPEYGRIVSSGHGKPQFSHYINRMVNVLRTAPGLFLVNQNSGYPNDLPEINNSTSSDHKTPPGYPDQQKAVAEIIHIMKGQRRRPVVLTADRGRGKSAALGIAAGKLIAAGVGTIGVTGLSRDSVDAVFKHAGDCDSAQDNLQYFKIDQLLSENPPLDMLLVDEAATIPLPTLTNLLHLYPRMAFASTVHGYEGTGRGFALKFREILDHHTRGWKRVQLNSPIRWAEHDPVERFLFEALLLDAEPRSVDEGSFDIADLTFEILSQQTLAENSDLLRDTFGLLIQAHYRTRPFDLRHLLDSTNIEILRAHHHGITVGVTLMVHEGGFDQDTARKIWENQRRPNGHLLAEVLCAQQGMIAAAKMNCIRVMRIVVRPEMQRQGIGGAMLRFVQKHFQHQTDFIGTSFGASAEVVCFWKSCEFKTLRVGINPSPYSGSNAICMIYPCSAGGAELLETGVCKFLRHFFIQLKVTLQNLDPVVVCRILQSVDQYLTVSGLDEETLNDLRGIAFSGHSPENFPHSMEQLFLLNCSNGAIDKLPISDLGLFVAKVLQGRNWEYCSNLYQLNGRKQGVLRIREIVAVLLVLAETR